MYENCLKGHSALVTGSARRLGRAVALELARAGADVIIHCNSSKAEAEAVKKEAIALGVDATVLSADFSVDGGAEGLIEAAFEVAPDLNLLVNSASVFPSNRLAEVTLGDINSNVLVNAWAPFVLSRSFAARAKSGSIVNMLDSRITDFDHSHAAYHMSKHMLALLTRLSAMEFAPSVAVNGVAPGLVLPPVDMDAKGGAADAQYLAGMASGLPLKKHGEPEDVAKAVLFLLASSFITGQIIYVDGGRHIRGGE
ncbi:MAG: SDR family oxidoreductase [Proteobacteria bacterium]|nr:SDR family oxidoreductase [Pseudomonadota bacterium]